MIEDVEKARHWRFFLLLESDFENALRFVEPEPENAQTFSLEFARQLGSTCAQFEIIARLLCAERLPNSEAETIGQLRDELLQEVPDILGAEAVFMMRKERRYPFKGWEPSAAPKWWTAYNKVKHDPSQALPRATLTNITDAVAGLGLLTALYVGTANIIYPARLFDFEWAL